MIRLHTLLILLFCFGAEADTFKKKMLYWPFLENGYSTYHSDAYRSDSTWIEPAQKYQVAGRRGPSNFAFVTANLDYDLWQSVFPIFAVPNEPKIYSYYEAGTKTGQLAWENSSAGIQVDNCSMPWSSSIDADHNVYFSDCRYLYSLTSKGVLRWKSPLPRTGVQVATFIEVFFTPQGDVGGVTNFGVLALYDRANGRQKLSFQLPEISGADKAITTANLNAPSTMLDPANPKVTRVFITATLERDGNADGVKDLGLYRVDIRYSLLGIPSAKTAFVSSIINGNTSATTPTISPSGLDVYISDKTSNYLWAFSTDNGALRWKTYVGHQQGSVSTSRSLRNYVFTGAGNRQLAIVDPLNPGNPLYRGFKALAEKHIPAMAGVTRDGLISTNILSTPTKLLFVSTVGYEVPNKDATGKMLWPMKAFLITADHQGNILFENEIPTTSDITLSILPDGSIFVPAGDIQARLAQTMLKTNPDVYQKYGTPMKPYGGILVLKPAN